jgi:group I intron endonuclease
MKATTALRKIKSGIYKITSPSGKVYIGQSLNISLRFSQYKNINSTKKQVALHRSFLKYGIANHSFEVIEECSIELLNEKERYWQEHYNVLKIGLNLCLVNTKEKKYIHCDNTKIKISESRKGIIFTDEHKEKIRQVRTGTTLKESTKQKLSIKSKELGLRPPSWKGKTKTKEHLQNISNSLKGRVLSDEKKQKVSDYMKKSFLPYSFIILDIDSGVYYNSVTQLSDLLKCNKTNLLKKIKKNKHPKYVKV